MTSSKVSSSERIRVLSDIASDVPTLLSSSSRALGALSGSTVDPDADGDALSAPSLAASKKAFTANAQVYFTTVQSIMARLRRQVYALEEAGITSAEAPVLASSAPQGRTGAPQTGSRPNEEKTLINGGLGNLDVAWLNSRVGHRGLDKESEVLDEAKRMVESALGRRAQTKDDADDNMTDA